MPNLNINSAMPWDQKLSVLFEASIIPDVIDRALLVGWYQSGKSTFPRTLFGDAGVEDITLHRQLIVDDLLGSYVPKPEGGFTWQDGPVARAMRHGKPLVVNEISEMSPDVKCAMHAVCDNPPAVTLATGERLKAKKGYCVIATSNFAPDNLPPGIFARFDVIMRVQALSAGLRSALGPLALRAENVASRGCDWLAKWQRPVRVTDFLVAAKLRSRGFKDTDIAAMLGFEDLAETDFLTTLAA